MKKHLFMIFLVIAAIFLEPLTCLADEVQVTQEAIPVPQKIVVLGDSIAAGYGLKGFKKSDPYHCDSYANLLAEEYTKELDGTCPFTLINDAVSGDTSEQLLKHLKKGEFDEDLINCDLVLISIGGNDILGQFLDFFRNKMNISKQPKLKEIADNVTDLEGVMDSIEELSTGIDTALDKYSQVILGIIEQINSKCDAVIIIQTLYDPFAKVPAAFMFQGLSKDKIEKLDEIIKDNSVDENGEQRYYVCDIYKPFKDKGLELTNMSKNDIHPNAEGHKLIAEKLDEKIRELTYTYDPSAVPAEPAQTEPESSSATEADDADSESSETVTAAKKMIEGHEDTVRTIIAVSACVLGAAALAVLIMTKEKKK